jgi:diguanylate cyclase (GGDEF)-like protein/PAS domain S-box-containing protein
MGDLEHACERVCEIVRTALGASDPYVIRAGDPHFVRLRCDCDPLSYEIKQRGYWLVWRELAIHADVGGCLFDVRDRLVSGIRPLAAGDPCTHVAITVPGDESNSELLVVRGPWPAGLTSQDLRFITLARPAIARLVSNVVNADHGARQRRQLESLADVSRAFNDTVEGDVLGSIATALAQSSGFDWVTVSVFNQALDEVVERAMNIARHSGTEVAAEFRERRLSWQDRRPSSIALDLARTGQPLLIRDVFAEPDEHTPEAWRSRLPEMLDFYRRAHIVSIAMFPLNFRGATLGTIAFASSISQCLDADQVEFLTSLTAQAATAMSGVRLYRDVEAANERLRQSEHRFRSLVQNASDIVTVMDGTGCFQYASPSCERIFGYSPDELVGKECFSLIHPDDVQGVAASLRSVVETPGAHAPTEMRIRHKDGSWRWLETVATNLLDDETIAGIVHNSRDITERKAAEEALRDGEARYRSLADNTLDLIASIEPDGRYSYVSPSYQDVLGYRPEEILGTIAFDLIHPDDLSSVLQEFARTVSDGTSGKATFRYRHKNGEWSWFETTGKIVAASDTRRMVVVSRDVTDRRRLEAQLRQQALHDALTGLANRAALKDRLDLALARTARNRGQVAVLFIDLDNFKIVNDTLGHDAGDELLITAAERLRECLRPMDTLARFGGDEFVVLVEDVSDAAEAVAVAERALQALGQSMYLRDRELVVRGSIGIALGSLVASAHLTAEELLRQGDTAMYAAKADGKARVMMYDLAMDEGAMERLELLADLEHAIERRQLVVHYQPAVRLKTDRIVAIEALVRWDHPRLGLLPPSRFVHLAEESGNIVRLGRWILNEACARARSWQERYPADGRPMLMSVNVSVKQLQDAGFLADVRSAIAASGVDPHTLVFEVTESAIATEPASIARVMVELRALGIRLAIDDFGAGYSSINYLRHFPFDVLKIDKSFVDTVEDDAKIVKGIIQLGKALGLTVVAEGVERRQQADVLMALGCDLGQGFYFSRPCDADDIDALLAVAGADRAAA